MPLNTRGDRQGHPIQEHIVSGISILLGTLQESIEELLECVTNCPESVLGRDNWNPAPSLIHSPSDGHAIALHSSTHDHPQWQPHSPFHRISRRTAGEMWLMCGGIGKEGEGPLWHSVETCE